MVVAEREGMLHRESCIGHSPHIQAILILVILQVQQTTIRHLEYRHFSLRQFRKLFGGHLPRHSLHVLTGTSYAIASDMVTHFLLRMLQEHLIRTADTPVIDHGKDLDTNYQEAFAQYKSLTEPSQSKENVYYASIAYLQSTDDTSELDKLKEKGDYQGLLTLAKEYYDGNGMDEEQTYRKPCQNRGDDLLIEDKVFAVVVRNREFHFQTVTRRHSNLYRVLLLMMLDIYSRTIICQDCMVAVIYG